MRISIFLSRSCLKTKISKIPINIGSVGKAKLKSRPGLISVNGILNGTNAKVNISNLSIAKKANSTISSNMGIKLKTALSKNKRNRPLVTMKSTEII